MIIVYLYELNAFVFTSNQLYLLSVIYFIILKLKFVKNEHTQVVNSIQIRIVMVFSCFFF